MVFDLEQQNEGEWFPFFESHIDDKGEIVYDDPKPDSGRVRIRSMAPIIEKQIEGRKRNYQFALNPQSRAMERVGYFEELPLDQAKKDRDDVWDYVITDFEGLFDAKGKEIECTRENKLKLIAIPMFDRFISKCLRMLSDSGVKVKEEQEKNSSSGLNG